MENIPEKIYLNIEPLSTGHLTWSENRVNETDIVYLKKTNELEEQKVNLIDENQTLAEALHIIKNILEITDPLSKQQENVFSNIKYIIKTCGIKANS